MDQVESNSTQVEMEAITSVKIELSQYVQANIASLWREKRFTDVTLIVGPKSINAHRAILAIQSGYFETLLYGEMLEAGEQEILLTDISQPDLFVRLIEFCYTGALQFSGRLQDVLDTLALADRFGFIKLKDSLSEFLATLVSIDNVLSFLVYADLYQAQPVLVKCLEIIDSKANEILSLDDFYRLPPTILKVILSRDTFFVPEIAIFNAVIRWRMGSSSDEVTSVLSCVRLSEISSKELFTVIEPAQIFRPADVTDALRIQLKPQFDMMRPRGVKEVGRNLFEVAKFSSSGSVEYTALPSLSPPKITDGVIEMHSNQSSDSATSGGMGRQNFQTRPYARVFRNQHAVGIQQVFIPRCSSKEIDLGNIYLVNSLSFSVMYDQTTSPFSYKIFISKKCNESWEALFDFSSYDCHWNQSLVFPTQAVRCIKLEITSCSKPLKVKFVSCQFEEGLENTFKFTDCGIIGPLKPSAERYFMSSEPLCFSLWEDDGLARVAVLRTPVLVSQLWFKVLGPKRGDVSIYFSKTLDSSTLKHVTTIQDTCFEAPLTVELKETVTSYIYFKVGITKDPREPVDHAPPTLAISDLKYQALSEN